MLCAEGGVALALIGYHRPEAVVSVASGGCQAGEKEEGSEEQEGDAVESRHACNTEDNSSPADDLVLQEEEQLGPGTLRERQSRKQSWLFYLFVLQHTLLMFIHGVGQHIDICSLASISSVPITNAHIGLGLEVRMRSDLHQVEPSYEIDR